MYLLRNLKIEEMRNWALEGELHERYHTRTQSRTHARTHANARALTHTLTNARTHTQTRTLTHALTHALTHTRSQVCTHTSTHTRTHSRTHHARTGLAVTCAESVEPAWRKEWVRACRRTSVVLRQCMPLCLPVYLRHSVATPLTFACTHTYPICIGKWNTYVILCFNIKLYVKNVKYISLTFSTPSPPTPMRCGICGLLASSQESYSWSRELHVHPWIHCSTQPVHGGGSLVRMNASALSA